MLCTKLDRARHNSKYLETVRCKKMTAESRPAPNFCYECFNERRIHVSPGITCHNVRKCRLFLVIAIATVKECRHFLTIAIAMVKYRTHFLRLSVTMSENAHVLCDCLSQCPKMYTFFAIGFINGQIMSTFLIIAKSMVKNCIRLRYFLLQFRAEQNTVFPIGV